MFARIVMDFAHIFRHFSQIFRDFARIFDNSELLGVRLHPRFLHHSQKVSFVAGILSTSFTRAHPLEP